ncbi:hypothetical protein M3Y97_00649000 [Aphelenchoides bicaudatus]|nr:hypothetical protein M3Y97_00649000 [Aphelenchoides bicaudatus]
MLLVLCLLYLIVWVGNCNEKKVYVMHGNWAHSFGYSARLNFSIGTPEQSFIGVLCPHFTNLLVVDSDCGKQSKKCPRYCRDVSHVPENFMEMFCSTLCQQITQQNRPTYCINALTDEEPRVYNRQKSLTYKKSNKSTEWSTYYEKTRKLSGDYVKDRIVFRSLDGRTLLIDEMEFVSGMMLDHLLFYSQDSVIGIAPGNKTNPSFFLQLYNRKLIEQPVLSIASKDIAFQTLTVGGIDNKNCANWQEFDVLEDQAYGWIIEVDSFTILSHEFKRKTRILWDIMSSLPLFPLFAMDILVKEANFHKRISDYDADCSPATVLSTLMLCTEKL